MNPIKITLIGGPTALIEVNGFRLLTDPTLDAPGEYPLHLTMDVNDAIETAHTFPNAAIVPIHRDRWAHFTQNGADLDLSFKALSIGERLRMLEPGVATSIELAR